MKTETPWQREKRLKSRKYVLKIGYKKDTFIVNTKELIRWIQQENIIVRVREAGQLDDGTEFCTIVIEGFKQ